MRRPGCGRKDEEGKNDIESEEGRTAREMRGN